MLKGKRVFLRRFKDTDAKVILKWGQNPRYQKLAGFAQYHDLIKAKEAVQKYKLRQYSYVICLNKTQAPIGLIELYERGMDEQSGLLQTKEVGFLLDQQYEGHGYMTEALQLILNFAFIKLQQVEVWAGTFIDNTRSQKLLQKLGFRYVYTVDYPQVAQFLTYQENYYLLQRPEWLKINSTTKS